MNDKMSKMLDEIKETNKQTKEMKVEMNGLSETSDYLANKTNSLLDESRNLRNLTSEMNVTTASLLQITEELVPKVRPAILSPIRDDAFANLHKETSDLVDTKFIYASKYFLALEFQHWDHRYEGTAAREKFIDQAVSEFFGYVKRFVVHSRPLLPLFPNNKHNNLYALVATLHTVHEDQEINKGPNNQALLSMKSIIAMGLSEVVKTRSNVPNISEKCYKLLRAKNSEQVKQVQVEFEKAKVIVPKFVCLIGENEGLATYLLQLRFNFLVGVALANATKLNLEGTNNIFDTLWTEAGNLIKKGNMWRAAWKPHLLSQKSVYVLAYLCEVLEEALNTRDILRQLGVEVTFGENLLGSNMPLGVLQNMEYPDIPATYQMEHRVLLDRYYKLLKAAGN